jgi:hypothetical protein
MIMGRDIHMYLVKKGKATEDIYPGRNSEWFSNLIGDGWDDEYDYLPTEAGISPQAPKTLDFDETDLRSKLYHSFFYISVGKFREWFEHYRPDLKAGWVDTYTKWQIERKHLMPHEVNTVLPEDVNTTDYHFVEFVDEYDQSRWLYNYLKDNHYRDDVDITFWFDS